MKLRRQNEARRREGSAFTLMEMLVTMSVFILLSGAVFGIITATFKGVSTLEDDQGRRDQIVALHAFLGKQITGITPETSIVSYRRGDGDGLEINGIILGQRNQIAAIDAAIQPNGYYTLRLCRFAPGNYNRATGLTGTQFDTFRFFQTLVEKDDASLTWVPLVRDVTKLSWKFQDLNNPQWFDRWTDPMRRPVIVEFAVQQAGGTLQPVTMDFWVPNMLQPGEQLALRNAAANPTNAAPEPTPTP